MARSAAPPKDDYDHLQASAVRATVVRLQHRIIARFPDRNLREVAGRLVNVVDQVAAGSEHARRRITMARRLSRVGIAIAVLVTVATLYLALRGAIDQRPSQSWEWVPLIESTISDLVYAGIAVFFLAAVPSRLERGATLAYLHRLRSLAHVIDMHQLTKDPDRIRSDFQRTDESIDLKMTKTELANYLDYCSEMLSLVAKTAALCAEDTTDSVVLDTVSTIEQLTTGMSRKIWQKISLLQ
ncbi:hypothetical protein [Luteipulveratus mongoliensis]|uniref:Uncharacterized protein n=1 Tax=Luteipulveratus mongoliensis TaxID=571913 RepID=A0A0K1JF81_9MICO|nr:hypothetical protein [Luteipulveratus mongoliensis]AKU15233.1 hypothetical protein VV02_04080 [Luteipulveratus mongoliensis]